MLKDTARQEAKYSLLLLTHEQCQTARLARDPRFDGKFFVAVRTTGIFCRPICPAVTPKEQNVEYFAHAAEAANAGYRPCLRCHPDSAPGSWAWRGTETTFVRAVKLIEQGALMQHSLPELSERLGVSDRYLRKLFERYLGMSPKAYSVFKRLMFAKQLLHDSHLAVGEIAYASGFNSVRRFNDACARQLGLTPSQIRKQKQLKTTHSGLRLNLAFRPPFDWTHLLEFYRLRAIEGLESVDNESYSRSFQLETCQGWFLARLNKYGTALEVQIELNDLSMLPVVTAHIRRMFDLDADMMAVESHLSAAGMAQGLNHGIRLPGIWSPFEAGIRAVLGQQVSVSAARKLVQQVVDELGPELTVGKKQSSGITRLFPAPIQFVESELAFLKMPQRRKETLKRLAAHCLAHGDQSPDDWLALSGIGPWTVDYTKLRGFSEPNIFLDTDLGVKKAMQQLPAQLTSEQVAPWGSYATFQLWSQL